MARNISLVCDVCKKPTERIVGKLFYAPIIPGVSNSVHSNYTHHLDVGVCCKDRLLRSFAFKKRVKAREYHERRKAGRG